MTLELADKPFDEDDIAELLLDFAELLLDITELLLDFAELLDFGISLDEDPSVSPDVSSFRQRTEYPLNL